MSICPYSGRSATEEHSHRGLVWEGIPVHNVYNNKNKKVNKDRCITAFDKYSFVYF